MPTRPPKEWPTQTTGAPVCVVREPAVDKVGVVGGGPGRCGAGGGAEAWKIEEIVGAEGE